MKRVAIWGASGHALVVADTLRLLGYDVAGYIDNISPERQGDKFGGASVLGGTEVLSGLLSSGVKYVALGVGDNIARLAIGSEVRKSGISVLTAVHPRASIAKSSVVGSGTVAFAGSVVNADSKIGVDAIINTLASVDHECEIGDGAHIAPGAHLAGRVKVGRSAFVGVGSSVSDRVSIGSNSIIGAGSVIVTDIPPNVIAYGVPARVVRAIPQKEH